MSKPRVKLNILEERTNPLLERKELLLEVEHPAQATTTRSQLLDAIAAETKVDPQLISIQRMKTITNSWKTRAIVDIYTSPQAAERFVPRHISERNLPQEEREKAKAARKKPTPQKGKSSTKKT